LIKLAQGFPVNIDGIKLKLEDVDFRTIRNIIKNCSLNDQHDTLFTLFMTTHPKNKSL